MRNPLCLDLSSKTHLLLTRWRGKMRLHFTWSCQLLHLIYILGLLIFKWHQTSTLGAVSWQGSGQTPCLRKANVSNIWYNMSKNVLFVNVSQGGQAAHILLCHYCLHPKKNMPWRIWHYSDWLSAPWIFLNFTHGCVFQSQLEQGTKILDAMLLAVIISENSVFVPHHSPTILSQ